MAHEITKSDGLVLHKQRAWHGLGTIVEDAPTPAEALQIAGLGWTVDQRPAGYYTAAGEWQLIGDKVANVRSDTGDCFGVFSTGYQVWQNRDLADFCQLLADESGQNGGSVRCETAGSIQGGRKVWYLLKGESFAAGRSDDQVWQYVLVSNSHDGSNALRVTPTTVRVVCSNTLHMVVPRADGQGSVTEAAYVARHTGDLDAKLREAREALKCYGKASNATKEAINTLAAKSVTREQMRAFWLECYQSDFGAIPANSGTKTDARKRKNATEAFRKYEYIFERESSVTNNSLWGAMNAYSGWTQKRKRRGKDGAARVEAAISSNLFGVDAERTMKAFRHALTLAV